MQRSDMFKALLCYPFERNYNKKITEKNFNIQNCNNYQFIDMICYSKFSTIFDVFTINILNLNREECEHYLSNIFYSTYHY